MFSQPGFFDLSERYEQLSAHGDPLERLSNLVDWKIFNPLINRAFRKANRDSPAGRKPYNRLMMFKILVIQSLYNLSDNQLEYQIRDRLSFMRFLGLSLEDSVPDEKTIWAYREVLIKTKTLEILFDRFERYLDSEGFSAQLGHIVDASIVEAPRQRNSRDDNKKIKEGEVPEHFEDNPNMLRQKDVDARWTKKNGETYYGYKAHVCIDTKHKLVRSYDVTPASTGDINCLESLLSKAPKQDNRVWADSAYYSEKMEKTLKAQDYESRLNHRFSSHQAALSERNRENKRRSKIRKRVEHVFGFMENSMGGKFIRTIGITRARAKIGLMNLVHNMCRYEQLCRLGAA